MKRRLLIGLAVLAIAALACTLYLTQHSHNLYYDGKSVDAWAQAALIREDNGAAALRALGSNAVPHLEQLLQARDSSARKKSWSLVAKLPSRWRALAWKKVGPPNAVTSREAAARALGIIGKDAKPAIPLLAQALHDQEGRVAWEASGALARIGKDSVPALIDALKANDLKVRHTAACALGEIGPDAQAAIPLLIQNLVGPSDELRNSITYSLGKIGRPAFMALTNIVAGSDPKAQEIAAKELMRTYLSFRAAAPGLIRMAQDSPPKARRQAIETLGAMRIANDSAMNVYTNALRDADPDVRLAAVRAIAQTGWRVRSVAPELARLADDPSELVRGAARGLLQQTNN